jgi:hypothetical protein
MILVLVASSGRFCKVKWIHGAGRLENTAAGCSSSRIMSSVSVCRAIVWCESE